MALSRPLDDGGRALRLKVLDAQCSHCNSGWHWLDIRSDFNRLYWVADGGGYVQAATQRIELQPGYLFLFPVQQTADYICPQTMELHWLHFRLELFPGVDVFGIAGGPTAVAACPDRIVEAFVELESCMDERTPVAEMCGLAIASRLISHFMPSDWATLRPRQLERLAPAFVLIDESYSDPSLSLPDMAAACELHPTYFSNLFSRTLGMPPNRFLLKQRLGRACAELQHSDAAISTIATRCGFRDPHYFSRVFSRQEHRSPRQYRRDVQAGLP